MTISGLVIEENVPLAPLTTFGIGGPARFFAVAENLVQLIDALAFAKTRGLETLVLGGGSNLLVSDHGFRGLVVKLAYRGVSVDREDPSSVAVTACAGEDWDAFVEYCVGRGLAGIECLSGIPGLVGATPIQNVGAYGQEVSQTITAVNALDVTDNNIVKTLQNIDCGFGYRTSTFNTINRGRYIILSVTFLLKKNTGPYISYRDLKEYFGGGVPTLSEARHAVLSIRGSKSMVIDPLDPNSRSAGSFFKNPVVTMDAYNTIFEKLGDVPSFPVDRSHVKLPAAWLIEQAGFSKGYSRGRAGISGNHTLALINRGGASAAEIIELMDEIRARVRSRFGISLTPEPNFIGFDRT